ncbi:aminodeoxychorismate synthase component I [Novosphingobium sp. Leaf2]|uniref:aminodeoxychorismate synthase component I n=1 Tax=Novosphingobium sp. Leaf2 TaxID=1735670 RepID=UPI0006F2A60C|nr:aminodeoxychorismate synthase component I [Novosphingobium sp. Leaf2]KQM21385.1 aminobenzoate synthetase [Novosphingobium sp. Leaf2]
MHEPFVLLDDARPDGAADARVYRAPSEIVVARKGHEVAGALDRIDALSKSGLHLAGYLTYEAGLALEPCLAPLLDARAPAPLVWFGAFEGYEAIAPAHVPDWLAAHAGPGQPAIGPLEPQIDFGAYERAFDAVHAGILAGDIYQANLTLPLAGPWRGDPLALYAALRPRAAAGYGGVIHDGARWHLSFSPELFFACADGKVEARPMKGTRPRGHDASHDAALRADLASSTKDRAENLMILDLMRNDLARVAVAGSVRVERPFAVESYPTVHQMVSTVRASLLPRCGAVDVLRALFPCGSITGAPKIRAMEVIAAVEPFARGPYCGAMGFLEPTGEGAFNVAIRTVRLDREGGVDGGGRAVLGVGSAVVADSQALPEWRECLVKGGFVRESEVRTAQGSVSPASFDLIETMRFTPQDGIALLELHLQRISASAAALGFAFDRHAVRNAIQALCFEADDAGKLRLVVGRSGAFALELAELPPAMSDVAQVAVLRMPVDSSDWRLRHKTSDRGFYDKGLELAKANGAHEAILLRDDGLVTEGCFTNLFVERDGRLLTPPAALGLLPGVLRRSLLEEGRAREANLALDDLADGFFIGNALRGLVPARLLA